MSTVLITLKYGLRLLVKRPVFMLVAVVTLALGIGANTAIFSIVNAVLLENVPYEEPSRLFFLRESYATIEEGVTSYVNFIDWRNRNRVFETMVAHQNGISSNLTGDGEPEVVNGVRASADLLAMLRIEPLLGRPFTNEEDRPGGPPVVILSYGLWQRRFGGDRNVLGTALSLDGEPFEIVGVMPAGFQFPLFDRPAELWLPIGHFAEGWRWENRDARFLQVTGRLLPGIDPRTARADMLRVSAELAREYPLANPDSRIVMHPLRDGVGRGMRPALLVLSGAVALILLIACVNMANLLLTSHAGRSREMALRGALGASWTQLTRQLLAEAILLSLLGAAAGLGVAVAGAKALVWLLDLESLPGVREIVLHDRILLFTLATAVASGLLFGLLPAFRSGRINPAEQLKEGARGSSGMARLHLRSGLVVAQMTLASLLLAGAVLALRSFSNLTTADPGLDATNVLTFQVRLSETVYPGDTQKGEFFEQLLERVKNVPGVLSAATTMPLPLQGRWAKDFQIEGREPPQVGMEPFTDVLWVSPGYFETMGVRLLRGRTFSAEDQREGWHIVVDQRFAESVWPDQDPLGKRVRFVDTGVDYPWLEVIGVVQHVKSSGVNQSSRMQLYQPSRHRQFPFATVVVRTASSPGQLVNQMRAEVLALDPNQPIARVVTMEELVARTAAPEHLAATLLGTFAALATLLAGVGIYGVIAYSVAQRGREIAIRMALGAHSADVLRLVLEQGLRLVLLGAALGLTLVLLLGPLAARLLYGVSPRDPSTLLALPLVLSLVALIACVVPAVRASRVKPAVALQQD